jgi:hypothetical protein
VQLLVPEAEASKNLKAVAQRQRQLNAISIQQQSALARQNELLKNAVQLG